VSTPRPAPLRPLPEDPLVSVVVCTLGREPRLVDTVRAVLAQTHRTLELVVVDNDPVSGRTAGLLADLHADERMRVVLQPVRGLSAARNAGLAAARGEVVAFTDDDAVPDPTWLAELLSVLRDDRDGQVAAVTGRVVATETRNAEQRWFEESGVFDKGLERTVWSLRPAEDHGLGEQGPHSLFFPYTAGEMGTGNNMLFRTAALRDLGGFDEALGAGSPARGGEDLDVFRRVVLAGHVLVYTPQALVRHHHRETYEALQSQMFGYGVGMAASLTKVVLDGGSAALDVLRCLPLGVYTLLSPGSSKNVKIPPDTPAALVRWELLGYLAGPFLYLYSRVASRRRRTLPPRRPVRRRPPTGARAA
jgi:glycosyltransferase involved in cell wall biosynthesis